MNLDIALSKITIGVVGPEDRALLRSNPSAAADAGMRAWGWSWTASTPRPEQGKHPGRKAINLGVWGRAPVPRNSPNAPTGVPYGKICRAWRMGVCYPGFRSAAPWAKIRRPFGACRP